jgi:quinol-cytochrome oxidoreductase complex cytochrome b subunit
MFAAIQIITGLLLSFHYNSSVFLAFESVEHIMRDVNYGWFLRYAHANCASFFFLMMYLHLFRGIFYKSYLYPRDIVWNSGIILLIVSIVVSFIGYVLPWGQMSYWAATVITNLVTALPKMGDYIIKYIWGGFTVSGPTLNRFFSLHYILAIVLIILIIFHIALLHETSSSNSFMFLNWQDISKFYRNLYSKDFFIFLVVLFACLFIIFYYPNLLGHPDNYIKANPLVTPTHIVPEWYFLPFYAVLRSIDNKLLGVVLMLSSILVLNILTFCKLYIKNEEFLFENSHNFFFYLLVITITCLWFVGSLPAEYPYIGFGKFFTNFYFSLFLIIYFYSKFYNVFVSKFV